MRRLLEIAAFNLESAIIAAEAGADRIELCSDQSAGGLTPALEDIIKAKALLNCPFFVMIRPKPGDFVYTIAEIDTMKAELLSAKENGVAGFVFGIMKEDGSIDEPTNTSLIELAKPLPCTFHRAFDEIEDKHSALEILIRCGFQRILTSGGVGNAVDYSEALQRLIVQAKGRIIVMPGGGVRVSNIHLIKETTQAAEYHSAAITDGSQLANAVAIKEMKAILGSGS